MPSFLSLFNTLTWTQNFQGSQLGPVCWDGDDDVMGNNVNPCSYVQMAKCVWVCRSLNEIRTDGLWEQLFNCSAQDKDLLHSPTRFTGQMERDAAVNRKTAMTVLFKLLKTVAKWRFYCWLLAVDYFHYRGLGEVLFKGELRCKMNLWSNKTSAPSRPFSEICFHDNQM